MVRIRTMFNKLLCRGGGQSKLLFALETPKSLIMQAKWFSTTRRWSVAPTSPTGPTNTSRRQLQSVPTGLCIG